jgi:type I restriction enzyme, S subunit
MSKWPIVELGEVASLVREALNPSAIVTGTKYIGLEHIPSGGGTPSSVAIRKDQLASQKYKFDPGDILFGKLRPYLAKIAIVDFPGICSTDIIPIRTGPMIDRRFLAHYLLNPEVVIFVTSRSAGVNLPRIAPKELTTLRIPLPPAPEQRRIAAILDQADNLRAKRHETVERIDDAIQATFISVFGMLDANPHQFPIITLGELCSNNFRNGLSPSKSGTIESKVLTLSAITRGRFDSTCVKNARFNCLPPMEQRVDFKDFLICRGNGNISLVGRGQFPDTSIPTTTYPDTIIAARVETNKVSKEYIQQAWKSRFIRNQIESAARTTNGTYKINQRTLSQIRLPLPDHRRQHLFDTIVDQLTSILGRPGGV